MSENISNAIHELQIAAERIRCIEQQAREALFVHDDAPTHRQKLQEKTMLLMELPEKFYPFYDGLPEDARLELEEELDSIAGRAERAMELSSLFFMNGLLYPEDYQDGDPNDLEHFIDRLRGKYLVDRDEMPH
jgi:hypothetical protein